MTNTIKVASIQFEPQMFNQEQNIAALSAFAIEAAQNGARLIVMPEMATTGYCWSDENEIEAFVETVPGPSSDHFSQIAKQYDCWIAFGMPEKDATTVFLYNSAVLVGPEGVVGVHRKTHPFISDPRWALNGDLGHQVFDTPIGKISMLICMDAYFMETARLCAVEGAQIICHLSNWLLERTPATFWLTRAWENQVCLVESNRWGLERGVQFSGGSCVIDHHGQVLASVDHGNVIVYANIQPQTENSMLAMRKPEHYYPLLKDSYLWEPTAFFSLYGQDRLPEPCEAVLTAVQCCASHELDENLSAIQAEIFLSSTHAQHVLVFPEKTLTGNKPEHAISQDHPVFEQLAAMCHHQGVYIVVGYIEQQEALYYNSARVIGPEGCIANYRQIHLSQADQAWATAGQHWCLCNIPAGRLGVLIGTDLLLAESARILAIQGCDIIACPANLDSPRPIGHIGTSIKHCYPIPRGADIYHSYLPRVRAGENNLWLVFSNSQDDATKSFGLSGVFGPDCVIFPRQEKICSLKNGRVSYHIDPRSQTSKITRTKPLLCMRHPLQYKALVKPHPFEKMND